MLRNQKYKKGTRENDTSTLKELLLSIENTVVKLQISTKSNFSRDKIDHRKSFPIASLLTNVIVEMSKLQSL